MLSCLHSFPCTAAANVLFVRARASLQVTFWSCQGARGSEVGGVTSTMHCMLDTPAAVSPEVKRRNCLSGCDSSRHPAPCREVKGQVLHVAAVTRADYKDGIDERRLQLHLDSLGRILQVTGQQKSLWSLWGTPSCHACSKPGMLAWGAERYVPE
jgi:hypothetical protein